MGEKKKVYRAGFKPMGSKWDNFICLSKQLLPLQHTSKYSTPDGQRYVCVWRMWFGKCWNAVHTKVEA